jgi:bifunctional non-homologous end joining protein LigD
VKKPLSDYQAKRDFSKTPEPSGSARRRKAGTLYLVQKHAASRLHYDFRLELHGVLLSWAVPEGPSLVPGVKRLAVHVEDHPIEYGSFEGIIPKDEYGGGSVMLWDKGSWTPTFDPEFGYKKGHLRFRLDGAKLKGEWHLVRMARKPREKQEAWLLIKSDDEYARREGDPKITEEMPRSVVSDRLIEEISEDRDRVWSSSGGGEVAQKKPRRRKLSIDPASIPNAKQAVIPAFIEPVLPTTIDAPPKGKDWVHEIKYDGYRMQLRIANGKAVLRTRNGLDWTERFRGIARAAAELPAKAAIIDGEAVALTEAGVPNFSLLQEGLKKGGSDLVYFAFDLLHLDGYDLRRATLIERKAALQALIGADEASLIRYSEHLEGDGALIFRHISRLGLEGIVSKKASSAYVSGRSKSWMKKRTVAQAAFVIAGFVPSTVDKKAVGALVLAEYVDKTLTASGHVGTGFTTAMGRELFQTLDPLRTSKAPIKDDLAIQKGAKWVEPTHVAQVEYRSRSSTGIIRHSSYKGLTVDRSPAEIVRPDEDLGTIPKQKEPAVRLSNPSRLLWPEQGVTKQGLADFYAEIAPWILPHIVERPLSLVRCPGGVQEQCFYQKHRWAGLSSAVKSIKTSNDEDPALWISDLDGLLELVQAGVLEIHPWGSPVRAPELPDRVTIDLDPGDGVPWDTVVEAALDVRDRLKAMGLKSFVKTTGGKGLHVVFPLTPKADWATVKSFAQGLAETMAKERPDRYLANMAKKQRHGRIYVDYLRNGRGATAVAAYSTRARAGAAVSTPLAWEELGPTIRADHFTIENLPNRLAYLDDDPWADLLRMKQRLP